MKQLSNPVSILLKRIDDVKQVKRKIDLLKKNKDIFKSYSPEQAQKDLDKSLSALTEHLEKMITE